MRYFLDTEIIDDGHTIDLISIGIVCEDGRELYLQSADCTPQLASQWVKDHVLSNLTLCPHVRPEWTTEFYANFIAHGGWRGQCTFTRGEGIIGAYADCPWRTRLQMMHEVRQFFNPSDGIELWGWCAGYDWVALCQLFGTMMDLPSGWPHYMHDLQGVLDKLGIADDALPPQTEQAHNALADARYIRQIWQQLHA